MYDGGPTFMTGSAICAIDTRFVHHALPAKNVPPYPPPAKSRNRPFKPLGLQFAANTCARIPPVIQPGHSSLPPQGKPGFHAEWLRDGPCDATTTCLGKPGVWCQLSLASAGNMRFGVASALFADAARTIFRVISRSLMVEPVTRPRIRSHSRTCEGRSDDCIRITMPGMRQELWASAAFNLRRVFFPARGGVRSRVRAHALYTHSDCRGTEEHVALSRASAGERQL